MRKLMIGDQTWEYMVGKENVRIVSPTGDVHVAKCWAVNGTDASTYERGQWKRTSDGAVTPGQLRKYIEEAFLR